MGSCKTRITIILKFYFFFNTNPPTQLHGTYRRKDRVYNENTFYGKGLALDEVSADALRADIAERNSENPLAYKGNVNVNALDNLTELLGSSGKKQAKSKKSNRKAL